jgi:hypothetical protein
MVPPCIVMEFLHNGSLADVIKKRPQELTFERSMVILQGVANGMVLLLVLHTLECVLIFGICICVDVYPSDVAADSASRHEERQHSAYQILGGKDHGLWHLAHASRGHHHQTHGHQYVYTLSNCHTNRKRWWRIPLRVMNRSVDGAGGGQCAWTLHDQGRRVLVRHRHVGDLGQAPALRRMPGTS